MTDEPAIPRTRTTTRPIKPTDRGRRTDTLDLALRYDPITRTYYPHRS